MVYTSRISWRREGARKRKLDLNRVSTLSPKPAGLYCSLCQAAAERAALEAPSAEAVVVGAGGTCIDRGPV